MKSQSEITKPLEGDVKKLDDSVRTLSKMLDCALREKKAYDYLMEVGKFRKMSDWHKRKLRKALALASGLFDESELDKVN